MSKAQTTETFNCRPDDFFKIISDYSSYPDFLDEVRRCEVVGSEGSRKLVEYSVNVIKTFKYRLWMDEGAAPLKLTWTLDSGDLFKESAGSWELVDQGGRTRATYTVDAKFKVFVPGPVAKALVSVNLPNMMRAYHKRVAELYGKK